MKSTGFVRICSAVVLTALVGCGRPTPPSEITLDFGPPALTASVRFDLLEAERAFYTVTARGDCDDPGGVTRLELYLGVTRFAASSCTEGRWQVTRDGVRLPEQRFVVYGFDPAGNEARLSVPGASSPLARATPSGVVVSGTSGAETTVVRVLDLAGAVLGTLNLASDRTRPTVWTLTVPPPADPTSDRLRIELTDAGGNGTLIELPILR